MTYSESAKDVIITHERARKEIEKHLNPNHEMFLEDLEDFYNTCGKKETYNAHDVLAWLGY